MNGDDIEKFKELLRIQNGNLEILREDEGFLDRTLIELASAIAYDCIQWENPLSYLKPNAEVVDSAARYASLINGQWQTEGGMLVFAGGTSLEENDWLELIEKGKNLHQTLLDQHLDSYGRDSEESVITAYRETNTCLTYMTAAACARSTDVESSVKYFEEALGKILSSLIG